MKFIKEPELLDINGGWCLIINNENCDHSCTCEGCFDICVGVDVGVCVCDNDVDYGC